MHETRNEDFIFSPVVATTVREPRLKTIDWGNDYVCDRRSAEMRGCQRDSVDGDSLKTRKTNTADSGLCLWRMKHTEFVDFFFSSAQRFAFILPIMMSFCWRLNGHFSCRNVCLLSWTQQANRNLHTRRRREDDTDRHTTCFANSWKNKIECYSKWCLATESETINSSLLTI